MTGRFCREERFKDAAQHVAAHAQAIVRYVNLDIVSRPRIRIGQLIGGQLPVRRRDPEHAASRHGVASVDRQIQQSALKLSRVAAYPPSAASQAQIQLDFRSERPPQHVLHAHDELIGLDHARQQCLPEGERQHPVDETRGRLRRLSYGVYRGLCLVGASTRDLTLDHGKGDRDHLKQVIEVVRDPARQLPYCFHFLRLGQAFLAREQRFIGPAHLSNRRKGEKIWQGQPKRDRRENRGDPRRRLDEPLQAVERRPQGRQIEPMGCAAKQNEDGEQP